MLVDSHCHLDYDVFEDRSEILRNAAENDVRYMLSIAVSPEKLDAAVKIADAHDHIFASVGVHPHEADKAPDNLYDELAGYAARPRVVGIGETGLDYYYGRSSRDNQIKAFETHLQICAETQLPAIIHTRDADEDTIAVLKSALKEKEFPVLIHCFTAGYDMAKACLDLGATLSISGIVTFKRSVDLQETVKKVPIERLLIETDAPYLAPEPHRGKRNEPAFVVKVAEKLAALKGISFEEVAKITTENFFSLFKKADNLRKIRESA